MNNLTKIAALPTGGGCQSALRPEDRGAERRRFATGGFVPRSVVLHTAFWMIGDQIEAVSIEPLDDAPMANIPPLTVNFGSPPIDPEEFLKAWCKVGADLCSVKLKGGGA